MILRFVFLAIFLFFTPFFSFAQNDDGFGSASKIEGQHFNIYYKSGIELNNLIDQLKFSSSDEILSGHSIDPTTVDQKLSSMVDILFYRASDILDLHVDSYKGNIKIFSSVNQLTDFYNSLYHAHVPCSGYAFYIADYKTVYISAEYFTREVLGHEIGHAIMSSYFVVGPSVKIQEVLAGYIEYQLRKSSN